MLKQSTMKSNFRPEYNVFRCYMTTARKEAGITQAKLAKLLGKPQSFVAKYENGERRLDVVEFLIIASVLSIDPCEIIREMHPKIIDASCEDKA